MANPIFLAGLTMSFNKAGLAIKSGGSSPDFLTANTVNFMINGKLYSKTAAADNAFSSGHTALAASQQCMFAVLINSSGTISTAQGTIVSATDVTNTVNDVPYPDIPDGKALLGFIEVKTDSTHTFTPGTTNLDATGVTATYIDAGLVPDRPSTT